MSKSSGRYSTAFRALGYPVMPRRPLQTILGLNHLLECRMISGFLEFTDRSSRSSSAVCASVLNEARIADEMAHFKGGQPVLHGTQYFSRAAKRKIFFTQEEIHPVVCVMMPMRAARAKFPSRVGDQKGRSMAEVLVRRAREADEAWKVRNVRHAEWPSRWRFGPHLIPNFNNGCRN